MIQLKERKEMDEAFKKAQKPWAKLLQKVERTRLEYHTACKQERTAQNQERNASGDSSLSPDQVSGNLGYGVREIWDESVSVSLIKAIRERTHTTWPIFTIS